MLKSIPKVIVCLLFFSVFDVAAAELWVSADANNQETCGPSAQEACDSIQLALNQATPGDVILVTEGVYREDSSKSPHTSRCTWLDHIYGSLCVRKSGQSGNPITLSAAPGSEGNVVVDSEGKRVGIHLMVADYITIKNIEFRNNYVIGIASWGQTQNEIPNIGNLSVGVVLENNRIINTHGEKGLNISGIGMWGSKDWVVRRNHVEGVSGTDNWDASCIQSYGVINALIEHNELKGCAAGIFWKDHFIKNESRELYVEATIRYNNINAHKYGFQVGPRGQSTVAAGHNYVHNNIIHGFTVAGIFGNMTAAAGMSGSIHVKNNIIAGHPGSNSRAMTIDSFNDIQFVGNVVSDVNITLETLKYSDTKIGKLVHSDYNIYIGSFRVFADRYSDASVTYGSLEEWQAAEATSKGVLAVSQPDSNSVVASRNEVFQSGTFRLTPNSIARGFMADGTLSAGPYTESGQVIGWPVERPEVVDGFTIE